MNGVLHCRLTGVVSYFVTVQSLAIKEPDQQCSNKDNQGSFPALLQSNLPLILTPEGVSSRICANVGGSQSTGPSPNLCEVPCDIRGKPGGLHVKFENDTIHVSYDDLLMEANIYGHAHCFLAVADSFIATNPPKYILGAPFLRAAYVVFDWDNRQVHLAQVAGIDFHPTKDMSTMTGCDEFSACVVNYELQQSNR